MSISSLPLYFSPLSRPSDFLVPWLRVKIRIFFPSPSTEVKLFLGSLSFPPGYARSSGRLGDQSSLFGLAGYLDEEPSSESFFLVNLLELSRLDGLLR